MPIVWSDCPGNIENPRILEFWIWTIIGLDGKSILYFFFTSIPKLALLLRGKGMEGQQGENLNL